jgi:hypothetical protein
MSQEVIVHGHMSLLSHQESGKEKVSHSTLPYLLPIIPMSAYSANLLNESPANTPPASSPLQIPFNPVPTTIAPQYSLLSPQTTLNTLTTQSNLNETIHAIAYGLISTVHNQEVIHTLESK